MFYSILPLFCLALAASVRSDKSTLEWPDKYSFEITKITVSSGLVEDIKVWHSKKESRVEHNKGALLSFISVGKGRRSRAYHYSIHPEFENEENKVVCQSSRVSRWDSQDPEDVLPSVDDFEKIGEEQMKNIDCTKFYKQEADANVDTRQTLWAAYDSNAEAYYPVRYEVVKYGVWLGNIDSHEIWDFDNYQTNFEDDIFDPSEYCPKFQPIRMDDDAVTKHLLFMDPEKDEHVDHVFNAFKNNHNKVYAHEEEHTMRKRIFRENMRLIKSTNRRNLGYKLSVNKFADRTPQEMTRHMGLLRRSEGEVGTDPFPYKAEKLNDVLSTLPSEYDLRLLGYISSVKNQQTCGSCWTFGTTSAVEGALARTNGGRLMKLSNQALIDCAWEYGAYGCDGGSDTAAYGFMMKYGMPTEEEYGTYTNEEGYCNIKNATSTYKITGFVDVTPNSIGALKVALYNHGPLSVSVHVTDKFSLYNGGIFYDLECDPQTLNHEVTLVGYGESNGETFWILKNSWGQDWGIDGYMHIAAKENNCGVMTEPTYVLF